MQGSCRNSIIPSNHFQGTVLHGFGCLICFHHASLVQNGTALTTVQSQNQFPSCSHGPTLVNLKSDQVCSCQNNHMIILTRRKLHNIYVRTLNYHLQLLPICGFLHHSLNPDTMMQTQILDLERSLSLYLPCHILSAKVQENPKFVMIIMPTAKFVPPANKTNFTVFSISASLFLLRLFRDVCTFSHCSLAWHALFELHIP